MSYPRNLTYNPSIHYLQESVDELPKEFNLQSIHPLPPGVGGRAAQGTKPTIHHLLELKLVNDK